MPYFLDCSFCIGISRNVCVVAISVISKPHHFILTNIRQKNKIDTNLKPNFFQNVSIIFFSAAKETNERKISEVSEESIPEEIDSETDSAISDTEDNLDDDSVEKEALKHTEEDIELFKKQLGDLDKAVNVTADRIDRIQEILDRVVENLKLGKPIEDYPVRESTENNEGQQIEEGNEPKVINSHEIFDREKLLEVLKSQKVDRLKNPPRLSVGMIGYPNVGKSSSVNVLMKTKKVRTV